jgi:hypothetical protein
MVKMILDVAVAFLSLFWFIAFITSPMMFGAPGAADNKSNVYFVLGVLTYPILIFLIYYIFKFNFFTLKPLVPLVASILVILLGFKVLGYDKLLFTTIKGISSTGYSAKNSKVYFRGSEIIGVDFDSFTTEGIVGNHYKEYAKDKNTVYYYGQAIKNSDPSTFKRLILETNGKSLSTEYFLDSRNIYYRGETLLGANPANFTHYEGYLVSGGSVYHNQKKTSLDAETFVSFGAGYSKDKNGIYSYGNKILGNADHFSFEMSPGENAFGIDSNHVYRMAQKDSKILEGANPKSFRKAPGPDSGYYMDDAQAFYLPGIDSTEEDLVIENADLKSFKAIGWDPEKKADATDGKLFWRYGKLID